MDFGKLDDISTVDFGLPCTRFLLLDEEEKPSETVKRQVYIGPPVWANRQWVGKVYPSDAKERDFLWHYARQFTTIELNVTHYQIPTETTIARWIEATPPHFRFCPKWPQLISHDAQLRGVVGPTRQFIAAVERLGERLGTTFLQLGPAFGPNQLPDLQRFLDTVPQGFPLAVEFRHPDWFREEALWERTCALLRQRGVGTVITDVAGRRDVLHQSLSTAVATLRFVGNELHPTDYTRADAWVERLGEWFAAGMHTAYIFIHCGENTAAPELTRYWVEQLNACLGLAIRPPVLRAVGVQGSLF